MPDKNLLEYYIQHADKRFDSLDKKIDILMAFRWKIMGAVVAISGIISLGFQIFEAIAGSK